MALTLRVDPSFNKFLNDLKNHLKIGTGSGVIKFVVEDYLDKIKTLQETRRELADTKHKLDCLVDIHTRKNKIEKELSSFLNDII